MAQSVVVNQLGIVAILRLACSQPKLNGQHIRIDNGTRLGPSVVAHEPVVVGIVLGHSILFIQHPTLLRLGHQRLLASDFGITHQATASSQSGVSLRLDGNYVDL